MITAKELRNIYNDREQGKVNSREFECQNTVKAIIQDLDSTLLWAAKFSNKKEFLERYPWYSVQLTKLGVLLAILTLGFSCISCHRTIGWMWKIRPGTSLEPLVEECKKRGLKLEMFYWMSGDYSIEIKW